VSDETLANLHLNKAAKEGGEERRKTLYIKSRMEPIHQKYKANESASRHNPKKKQNKTINKNKVKALCNRNHGNEMMINKNLGRKSCRLSQID
jgi:hypothetical protein